MTKAKKLAKLERFFSEIVWITHNHDRIGDYAVVWPGCLSKALSKVDPKWVNQKGRK